MKINAMVLSWILRGLGLVCLLPLLFFKQVVWVLPGLEDPRIAKAMLWGGLVLFVSGAGLYYYTRNLKSRKQSDSLDDSEEL